MPGKRRKKAAEYRGEQNKKQRGIPRGTEQGNIMEIILSTQCESLTGSLGKGYGYYIRRAPRKDGSVRFFSQRTKHPPIPPDGHLRFIFACAEMAKGHLHIADISVKKEELYDALTEANHWIAARSLRLPLYNARDIINLKITFSL